MSKRRDFHDGSAARDCFKADTEIVVPSPASEQIKRGRSEVTTRVWMYQITGHRLAIYVSDEPLTATEAMTRLCSRFGERVICVRPAAGATING